MKVSAVLKVVASLVGAAIVSACTPSIVIQSTDNLDAGQVKMIKAEVTAPCGYTSVYAQYRQAASASWLNSAPPARSGNLYSSAIPNSQNFAEGDAYDFRWSVDYDSARASFLANCGSITPTTKSADASFVVPVCTPGAQSALPVALRGQQTNQWCWAASGQMIMEYLGGTVAQCTEANDRFVMNNCCNDGGGTCGGVVSAAVYQVNQAACINGGWPDFGQYGFDSTILNGALSWNQLRTQLSDAPHCRHTPVAFSWGWTGGGGHMMVASGYVTVPFLASMIGIGDFVVMQNPWPPCSGDSTIITYNEYVARTGHHEHWSDYYDIRRRP